MHNYSMLYDGWFAALGIFVFVFLIAIIAVLVLYLVGLWKLFQKAGKKGWEAIIPFYNTWVLVEISGLAWWYFLIIISNTIASILEIDGLDTVCTLASLVGSFFCYYNICKKLHKDVGFAILTTLFPYIMIPVFGLSSRFEWDKTVSVSEHGPIQGSSHSQNQYSSSHATYEESNSGNGTQKSFCPYCGSRVDEEAKFCGNCGKEIESSEAKKS